MFWKTIHTLVSIDPFQNSTNRLPHYGPINSNEALVESEKNLKQIIKSEVRCIHCQKSHYLKEKMDEFILVSLNRKPASF